MQNFPHVVFFATSRGKFFYLAREIIFAILAILIILVKSVLKFHYMQTFTTPQQGELYQMVDVVSYPKSRLNDTSTEESEVVD